MNGEKPRFLLGDIELADVFDGSRGFVSIFSRPLSNIIWQLFYFSLIDLCIGCSINGYALRFN
jgi:hypothetical protein